MTPGNLSRAEAAQRAAHVRVLRYDVALDVSEAPRPEQPFFGTRTTVTFTSAAPATFLDFMDGEVDALVVNGAPRQVRYADHRIPLDGLRTDAENVIEVSARGRYSRSGEGLHRFVDPVDGATYLYTQYEPADARRVFACFEQPDLKAPFVLTLTAPEGWTLLSNQSEVSREPAGEGLVRARFAPTQPISTYITAVVAGPYHRVTDTWQNGDASVPLSWLCRASLAEHLDADELSTITKQGLSFYTREFGRYVWGKYDQILVPEYNLGAMENPGLVTFTEAYLFRGRATRAQHAGRANTILHEMAHMWFGDLVTPRWWDDLWLKESFAEYMGAHASVAATYFTDAWVAFGGKRKAWAFKQDQLPTTHPIVADITDLEAAKQNFDGITYAKGAAALRQLVAFVGVDAFFAGARAYFAEHAFGSATLADLLAALERTSGRDLGAWSRAWLQTSGVDTLTPLPTIQDGRLAELAIGQDSRDARSGEPTARPHRLGVGLYALKDGALTRTRLVEVELDGAARTLVPDVAGESVPAAVLLNDGDLTYAKVAFDEGSLATWREHLGTLADPLARVIVWAGLWNMARDAQLPAADYVEIVLRQGSAETDASTLAALAANLEAAVERLSPPQGRDALREATAERLWGLAEAAPAGGDPQLTWVRTFARLAAGVPATADRLQGLLVGSAGLPGLVLDPDLRWLLWRALASVGEATQDELDAELRRDDTASGRTGQLACLARRPAADVKADAWQRLLTPGSLSNDHVDALLEGFAVPGQDALVAPYAEPYFEVLTDVWRDHSIGIAQRLVSGLFPHGDADGSAPEQHALVRRVDAWLAGHADAPGALRRVVVEERDHLLRALQAQSA